jgi:endoglucanase
MNRKLSKKLASSLMAAAMLTTATTTIIPSTVSAGQLLGETSFDYKALPWHIVESSPANQDFAIEEGAATKPISSALAATPLGNLVLKRKPAEI